jgi:hypothetical protein
MAAERGMPTIAVSLRLITCWPDGRKAAPGSG